MGRGLCEFVCELTCSGLPSALHVWFRAAGFVLTGWCLRCISLALLPTLACLSHLLVVASSVHAQFAYLCTARHCTLALCSH